MNKEEFIKSAEDFIYKEVAKNTNLLLGKSKTASLSTGMFLKLPIVVSVEHSPQPLPKLYKELKTFMPYFAAYTKIGNTVETFFTFIYHDEKDLTSIRREMERHGVFFAFVYMHEVQHILRKHNTHTYETMMTRIAGDIAFPHEAINIAEDHAINYSIKDLFKQSTLAAKWPEIEVIGMYKAEYHDKKMSDIEILKDMVEKGECITKKQITDMLSEVTCGGKTYNQPTDSGSGSCNSDSNEGKPNKGKGEGTSGKPDKLSTAADDLDASLSDLSDSLQNIISSNTKGTSAGELFEDLFKSIKVETGWFKKIKASFKRQVYYKTHDYTTNWSNLNNTFRRIYKSPKKEFIDNKINIILSVDHSGSMGQDDLQKLLYLMESESKRIASVRVLLHDMQVTKEFIVEDEYDIQNSPEFQRALATRYSAGGTSHACVFEYIQNMKIPDPNMVIYMSFSDNYSDIESSFKNYPIMRKLTNFWVRASGRPAEAPGTNISMC